MTPEADALPLLADLSEPSRGHVASEGRVAVVRPLLAVSHLDRDFEYSIPKSMADDVVFGVAVKVRFGGQDVTGYVVDVRDVAEHVGELKPIRRLVSPIPVLTPQVWQLAQEIAARSAGTVADVLRLAVPTRHAQAEKAVLEAGSPVVVGAAVSEYEVPADGPWSHYRGGHAFLRHVAQGEAPGAVWNAAPGAPSAFDWPRAIAQLVAATRAGGRSSLLVMPNARGVERVLAACQQELGEAGIVRLTAEDGPAARYTAFVRILRGEADVVIGTRAAMFAPVQKLGLALWWDDVHGLHAEPRAPYPHVRDVLRLRAKQCDAALVSGGWTRSVDVERLVELKELAAVEPIARTNARVVVTGDDASVERSGLAARARIPAQAWRGITETLKRGPVLVQVPRKGYVPALACARCREKCRCTQCHGPLGSEGADAPLRCRWCGHIEATFTCPNCGGHHVRSLVVGADRTADELGRAFPGVPIKRSGAPTVLESVSGDPALVIATPGAEPVAENGYAAALLLDAWAFLDRSGLAANERSLTAWAGAAGLVRPASDGGEVYLCGVPRHVPFSAVEALVRWAPGWFAEREFAERVELQLPPATRMAALEANRHAAAGMSEEVASVAAEKGIDLVVLGPLPLGQRHSFDRRQPDGDDTVSLVRYLVRWDAPDSVEVPQLLRTIRSERSASKAENVTVRVDPLLDGLG